MALGLPSATSPLDSPSHSLLHRQVAVDTAAPEQSVIIDASGNATIGGTLLATSFSGPLEGIVGGTTPADGSFSTLSASGLISADGGQIKFPATQSDSADANTLDDYEEGTWTPAITFGGAAVDVAYAGTTGGAYTRIGNSVTLTGWLHLSSKGSSAGAVLITGLPFTSAGSAGDRTACYVGQMSAISFADQIFLHLQNSTAYIGLHEVTNAGTITTIADTNFADGSYITFGCTYRAV